MALAGKQPKPAVVAGPEDGSRSPAMSETYRCVVEHLTSGATWTIALRNDTSAWPKFIGSDEACEIRIENAGFAPKEAELRPSGRHLGLTSLGTLPARARGTPIPPGEITRIDGPFEIGDYRFALGFAPIT
jgi:hypothetical protein